MTGHPPGLRVALDIRLIVREVQTPKRSAEPRPKNYYACKKSSLCSIQSDHDRASA
jgi:hypothetical protein